MFRSWRYKAWNCLCHHEIPPACATCMLRIFLALRIVLGAMPLAQKTLKTGTATRGTKTCLLTVALGVVQHATQGVSLRGSRFLPCRRPLFIRIPVVTPMDSSGLMAILLNPILVRSEITVPAHRALRGYLLKRRAAGCGPFARSRCTNYPWLPLPGRRKFFVESVGVGIEDQPRDAHEVLWSADLMLSSRT